MLISPEEIAEARELMGDDASHLTDEQIVELICEVKRIAPILLELVETMSEETKELYKQKRK